MNCCIKYAIWIGVLYACVILLYNDDNILALAATQHVRVQKRRIPVAVQLEKRISVHVLVVVQPGIWLFAADRSSAHRPVCRNRADLPVPGHRTPGLIRRECAPLHCYNL